MSITKILVAIGLMGWGAAHATLMIVHGLNAVIGTSHYPFLMNQGWVSQ